MAKLSDFEPKLLRVRGGSEGGWRRPTPRRPTDRLGRESRSQGVGRRVTGTNSPVGSGPGRLASGVQGWRSLLSRGVDRHGVKGLGRDEHLRTHAPPARQDPQVTAHHYRLRPIACALPHAGADRSAHSCTALCRQGGRGSGSGEHGRRLQRAPPRALEALLSASQITQTCDIMDFGRGLGVMCDVTPRGMILTGCEIMGTQREMMFTPVACLICIEFVIVRS
jgi:hypothetical protein